MAITREEVRRIAELARLEIEAGREPRVAAELSEVLEFVAALDRLDLGGCEPASLAPADAPLREDAPGDPGLGVAAALEMAPAREDGFFLVPPIVENLDP